LSKRIQQIGASTKNWCRADKKTHPQKVETSQGLVYLRYKEVEILIWEGKDVLY
jgi:hypothetical protein